MSVGQLAYPILTDLPSTRAVFHHENQAGGPQPKQDISRKGTKTSVEGKTICYFDQAQGKLQGSLLLDPLHTLGMRCLGCSFGVPFDFA
jgi:hypothetical protein